VGKGAENFGNACSSNQMSLGVVYPDSEGTGLVLRVSDCRLQAGLIALDESLPDLEPEAVADPGGPPLKFLSQNVFVFKDLEVSGRDGHNRYTCNESKDQSQAKRMHSASTGESLSGTLALDAEDQLCVMQVPDEVLIR